MPKHAMQYLITLSFHLNKCLDYVSIKDDLGQLELCAGYI